MSLNLLPLDRSSDKSSDSGGLLDLSSRTAGGHEDTWLFKMEAEMKGMGLIEEEEIPDDLLEISHEDSLNEGDCPSDSLNEEDLSKPQPLLLQCSPEHNAISVPPNINHEVVAIPSSQVLVEEQAPMPSSSVEPSADAQALLEDFGFNVKLPVANTNEDSGALLMGYEEPVVPPQPPEKVTDVQSLFNELGLDVGSSAPIKRVESLTTHVDNVPREQSPPLERGIGAQSLIDDFGFDVGSSVPLEPTGLPPTKVGDVPTTKQRPSSETVIGAQSLLDDFGFDVGSSGLPDNNELRTTHLGDTCMPSTEQQLSAEPTGNILEDFGFDSKPAPLHALRNEANVQSVDTLVELQPSSEKNGDQAEAQDLLEDFGFDIDLSAPHGGHSSQSTLPLSLGDNPDSHSLLQFDEKASASRPEKDLPCIQSTSSLVSEQCTGAQNPLEDFGFDSTNLHVSDPGLQSISPLSHNSSPPSTEQSKEAQNLLGDFDLHADLSIPCVRNDLLVPHSPTQNVRVTPLTSEQRDNGPNLLGDFGLDAVPHVGEDLLVPHPRMQNTTMPSSEKITDTQNLLKDFGFDVDASAPNTQNPTPSSSDRRTETQNLLGFDTKSSAPCTRNDLSNTHMAYDLLTPPSSSERNTEAQTLLDDFGFDVKTSSASSGNTDLTDTHDVSPPPMLSCSSSDCEPAKLDLPLIAFTDEVVQLWQTKEEKSPELSPISSGTDNKKAEQEQATLDGVHCLGSSKEEMLESRAEEERESTTVSVENVADGCNTEKNEPVKKKSRLQTPNQQLSKCSSFLRSPVQCSQLEEVKERHNSTFDIPNGSHSPPSSSPLDDNRLQSDEMLSGVKSSISAEEIHVHHSTLSTGSQSLNNSLSSEHSEASSVGSHVSLSATSKESRGQRRAVEAGPPGARRVGGKIPKPSAKSRPNIKPSLLPSKSATTLSKAPGAISKMPPPNSRLTKPKSTCSSVSNTRTKPSETTADSIKLANKSSRLPKVASSGNATKQSFNQKSSRNQPTCKSKLAPPSVALRKKQRNVTKENPVVRKAVPLTSSTPTTFSSEPGEDEATSLKEQKGGNDTFTISDAASSTVGSSPVAVPPSTPRTSKGGRRSLIPTPAQENRVQQQKQKQVRVSGVAVGRGGGGGGRCGIPSRVFKPRNGPNQTSGYGPVKSKGYEFTFGGESDVPTFGVARVVHSPLDKENRPATPHSQWSPIRRKKPLNLEEACIQCTKKVK